MKVKVALLLFLIFFAFASTIIPSAIVFSTPTSDAFTETRTPTYTMDNEINPTGDPIDNPIEPH